MDELLQEKLKTFQVSTPREIAAAQEEAEVVKRMAYEVEHKTADEIELFKKLRRVVEPVILPRRIPCALAMGSMSNPEGLNFEGYFPHWLASVGQHRPDLYERDTVSALLNKTSKPKPINGLRLKLGCAGAWEN